MIGIYLPLVLNGVFKSRIRSSNDFQGSTFLEVDHMTSYCSKPGVLIIAATWMALADGAELSGLPAQGGAEQPAVLLELGSQPASAAARDEATRVYRGDISAHQDDASIQIGADEVGSLHPGF